MSDYPEFENKMKKTCDALTSQLATIRAGRANAARRYLVANGVDAKRIRIISYGKEKPVALGSNEEAWAQNRNATSIAY